MPSKSKKQQHYMGMQLAKQRKSGHNDTGMSEDQLGEFAETTVKHGSLEDITAMENYAHRDKVMEGKVPPHPLHAGYKGTKGDLESAGAIVWGETQGWEEDGDEPQGKTPSGHGSRNGMSSNRDNGYGIHYGAPVDYFGPDTDYRAEEIDPHQYGKDWEPFPFKDVYKTGDKQWERGFRITAQDEYDESPTPGAVTDSQPMSEAHGAVNWDGAGPDREIEDYRAFDSQRQFARTNKEKKQPYAVDISGLDTKDGKDIR